jgi:hypothetical protein
VYSRGYSKSDRRDLVRPAGNMVLILAASESVWTGRSLEIRDENNEFPVNFIPWTCDNGRIVLVA